MGQENEVSTGFHFIEIHTRSVGLTLTTLLLFLLFALLLLCCYRRFCGQLNLCPPAAPTPAQPQVMEMQPLSTPYSPTRPIQIVYAPMPQHMQPHMPAISYASSGQASAPPAYAYEEQRAPVRTVRPDSPPRIVTLDRSPGPRRATPPALGATALATATAPPESL